MKTDFNRPEGREFPLLMEGNSGIFYIFDKDNDGFKGIRIVSFKSKENEGVWSDEWTGLVPFHGIVTLEND